MYDISETSCQVFLWSLWDFCNIRLLSIIILSLAYIVIKAKTWEKDQLVKHKDIELYLLLYIPSNPKE